MPEAWRTAIPAWKKGCFLYFSYRLLNLFPFCVYAELSDSKRFDCVTVW